MSSWYFNGLSLIDPDAITGAFTDTALPDFPDRSTDTAPPDRSTDTAPTSL